jgi:hypothetical protein
LLPTINTPSPLAPIAACLNHRCNSCYGQPGSAAPIFLLTIYAFPIPSGSVETCAQTFPDWENFSGGGMFIPDITAGWRTRNQLQDVTFHHAHSTWRPSKTRIVYRATRFVDQFARQRAAILRKKYDDFLKEK